MMVKLSLTLAVIFTMHTGVSIARLEKNHGSERIDTPSQYTKLETHHMEKRSGRFRSGRRRFGNFARFSTRSFKDPFTNSFRRSFKVFRENGGNNIKLDIVETDYQTNSNRRPNFGRLSRQNPHLSPFFKQRNYGPLLHGGPRLRGDPLLHDGPPLPDGPLSINLDTGFLPIRVIGGSPGYPGFLESDGSPRLPGPDGWIVVGGSPGVDGGIGFDPGEQFDTGIVNTPSFPINPHTATDHGMAIDPYWAPDPYMEMYPGWTMYPDQAIKPGRKMHPHVEKNPDTVI